MKRICLFLLIALPSPMTCGSVWAQASAQINGSVRDQSGAVLPGVEVTATQTDTGIIRTTITNETGSYILPNLALGPYRFEAALQGFRTFVQTGIVLQVNSNPVINVVLAVGQVAEQVEVQANATLVETRSVGVGAVMETKRIVELPLNGRNAQELILLSGAAVQMAPAGGRSFPNRLIISTAGSLGTGADYTLDGIRHIDPYDGYGLPLPFPDALAEFKVESTGLSAKASRATAVASVTKSGTNDFHGNLFEFVRNDLFNARNFYATQHSTLKRHQFGGTVGGPIQENKLFFFAGYQGTTTRQDPQDTRSFLPTAAMLAGDFTAFASPACNANRQITLRAPFVNNRVDPSVFSPAAVKLSSRLLKPDNPCGELTYGRRSNSNDTQIVGRMDYQLSSKHSLFGRFLTANNDPKSPFQYTPDNVLNAGNYATSWAHAFTLGSTYLISPSMVNAFRLSFSRANQTRNYDQYFEAADVGIKSFSYVPKAMNVTISAGFSLGGGPGLFRGNLYQISDDVSLTRGAHQFSFGGYVAESRSNSAANVASAGVFTFNGQQTGLGLADFLTGKVSDFSQGNSNLFHARVNYFSVFAQDAWQIRPRLTMNYGLRWSPIFPIMDYRRPVPDVLNFDIDRYRQGLRSTVFVNAPPGMVYAGDPGFVQKNNGANAAKPKSDVWNSFWGNFSPHLGFAWDVEGNGRTSVRASYGLNYEDIPTQYRQGTQIGQPPWGQFLRALVPAGGFDDPWQGYLGGNPFPIELTRNMPWVTLGDYFVNDPDLKPAYTQSWNLSIQREVVSGTLVSASYLGSNVIHIQVADPLNSAIFVPGTGDAGGNCFLNGKAVYYKVAAGAACSTLANTQDRRVLSFENPAFRNEIGRMARAGSGGTQNYHGMLLSVQRRTSRGVTVNANYTLSHCIGDYGGRSIFGTSLNVDDTYQDPRNRRLDRANCETDQRHNFNLTAVAETPQFANSTLRLLGAGWRLSGIYRRSTNAPLNTATAQTGNRTVTSGGSATGGSGASGLDRALTDVSSQRPNQVLADLYLDKSGRPSTQYLNPAAFAVPPLGSLGTLGRVNIVLPPSWQFDMALARVFRIREAQSMEFRVEAYNVTNSFRAGTINMNLSAGTFGQIRTSLDPRILQFALKYMF
ncbi:MAG TPA: carboxypeptidase-like regulatory domain-containing protein [Terriglobia bacterium]|nr:carboxypeptidase-like regulatory domain-containing protein [Terriglobia bacterium]